MRLRLTLLLIISSLSLSGCSLVARKSAIEINSYPVAKVFLDGKEVGMTPYKNRSLLPQEVEVKLVTNDKEWSKKIKLQNNISTVVDWEFGKDSQASGGYILYLEKTGDKNKAGIMINTTPGKSTVVIDNEVKGLSPIRISNIGEGDKHLALSFPNHKTIDIFMKSVLQYQLVVDAVLPEEEMTIEPEEEKTENILTEISNVSTVRIKIKDTETGWLRVREASSSAAMEIGRVNPGESYPMIQEIPNWYKIDLGGNKNGWISATYGEKIE
jgi:hypothetical protein